MRRAAGARGPARTRPCRLRIRLQGASKDGPGRGRAAAGRAWAGPLASHYGMAEGAWPGRSRQPGRQTSHCRRREHNPHASPPEEHARPMRRAKKRVDRGSGGRGRQGGASNHPLRPRVPGLGVPPPLFPALSRRAHLAGWTHRNCRHVVPCCVSFRLWAVAEPLPPSKAPIVRPNTASHTPQVPCSALSSPPHTRTPHTHTHTRTQQGPPPPPTTSTRPQPCAP